MVLPLSPEQSSQEGATVTKSSGCGAPQVTHRVLFDPDMPAKYPRDAPIRDERERRSDGVVPG